MSAISTPTLIAEFSLPAVHLFDMRRCVEYLETRPEANLDRLAVAGHSLGGMYATYLSVLDRRFKVTVANCSYPSFEARARGMKLGICGAQAVPCEPLFADSNDLLCAIAPHPLLMTFGDQDPGMTVGQAEDVVEKVCGAYESLGAGEQCTANIFRGGHAVDTPTIVPWLQRWL
jgi:dienelactone hydrolase